MKAKVQLTLEIDPLSDDQRKIEFQLRTALCLLAHEENMVQVESAPIIAVNIDSLEIT